MAESVDSAVPPAFANARGASTGAQDESDFSPRKIKISAAIVLGTLFGSTVFPMMALALLLPSMTEEFGWSRTEFSFGLSAMMLGGAISAPFLGRLVDRIGVRPLIIGGTAIVGLVTMLQSLQTGPLWQFILGFAVLGSVGSTAIGYSKVLGSLFTRNRGKALAIFGVKSSLAGALAAPIVFWLLSNWGWRGVFVGMGCIILSIVPVLMIWLSEPDTPSVPVQSADLPNGIPGTLLADALRDRTFWFITFAGFFAIIPAIGFMPHLVPYLLDKGLSMETGVGMVTVSSVAMAAGTLVGGWLLDRYQTSAVAAPFALLSTVGLLGLLFIGATAAGTAVLAASIALMGFAGGAKRPMGTFFQLRFFGLRDFASIVGVQSPILALGMGLSPPLIGWSYEAFGSYRPALIAMVAAMAITIALYLALGPYRYDSKLKRLETA